MSKKKTISEDKYNAIVSAWNHAAESLDSYSSQSAESEDDRYLRRQAAIFVQKSIREAAAAFYRREKR